MANFILCFQYREDAEKVLEVLKKRFAKYGLTLHPDKTRLMEFGRKALAASEKTSDYTRLVTVTGAQWRRQQKAHRLSLSLGGMPYNPVMLGLGEVGIATAFVNIRPKTSTYWGLPNEGGICMQQYTLCRR